MPYLPDRTVRKLLDRGMTPRTEAELNYVITRALSRYLGWNGLRYATLNAAIGALEAAKQEFYRRLVAPYEDRKLAENGDVYGRDT